MTANDGFTRHHLVSYNNKHNDANQEDNNDGSNDNHSWNICADGPTDAPEIVKRRERQKRNFLATLLLSQGVPMILGGDEISRTQNGDNNAYCQDTESTWMDWQLDGCKVTLLEVRQKLIPAPPESEKWEIVIDTHDSDLTADSRFTEPGKPVELVPLSLVVCANPRRRA